MQLDDIERRFGNRVVNPITRWLLAHGLGPPAYALVEATGRKSGLPRVVPVANGLDGDTFWLIAGLGDRGNLARNIAADPRVRVLAQPPLIRDGWRTRWRTGTATFLPGDDAWARHRRLGRGRPFYRLDGLLLRRLAAGDEPLTVRIDLDDAATT